MVGMLLEEDMFGVWKNKEALEGLVGSLGWMEGDAELGLQGLELLGLIQVSLGEGAEDAAWGASGMDRGSCWGGFEDQGCCAGESCCGA